MSVDQASRRVAPRSGLFLRRVRRLRDNHEGMPEVLAAYERDGCRYGAMRVLFGQATASYEFWVDEAGYAALRRVLQTKPFATTSGIAHRYFFAGRVSRKQPGSEQTTFGVRIESERDAKTYDFDGPVGLISTLVWFAGLKNDSELQHLRRID